MSTWHYIRNGVQTGPVSGAKLRALAAQGVIGPDTRVMQDGHGAWVEARLVKGLIGTDAAPDPKPGAAVAPGRASSQRAPSAAIPSAADPAASGEPTGGARGGRVVLVGAVVVVVLVGLGAGVLALVLWLLPSSSPAAADGSTAPAGAPPGTTASAAPAAVVAEADPRVGASGDFTVRVTGIGFRQYAGRVTDLLTATSASGRFLWFSVKVTNDGKSSERILPSSFTLRDAKGRTFNTSDEAMATVAAQHASETFLSDGNVPWMQDYAPGVAVPAQLYFDVPPPAEDSLQAAADAGYELVLDLGGGQTTIRVAAIHAAVVAAQDAFNAKFDRLMAAYDEASAPEAPIKSFDVTFGRPRWMAYREDERMPGSGLARDSCMGYFAGKVSVSANGIAIEPGWRLQPKDDRNEADRSGLGARRAPAADLLESDRLRTLAGLRESVERAVSGLRSSWLSQASVERPRDRDQPEGVRWMVARETTAEESEGQGGLSTVSRAADVIATVPGMKDVAARLQALREGGGGMGISSRHRLEDRLVPTPPRPITAQDSLEVFSSAMSDLDATAAIIADLAKLGPALGPAVVSADRDLSAIESKSRAASAFLPFIKGWFSELPPGTRFEDLDSGVRPMSPGTFLQEQVGEQAAGWGRLDDRAIAWIEAATVQGAPAAAPPRKVEAVCCRVIVDPFGFPVLVMFGSAQEREVFEDAVRASVSSWRDRWKSTAAEYVTLKIGESLQVGSRAMELQQQGRPIDIMARQYWMIPAGD